MRTGVIGGTLGYMLLKWIAVSDNEGGCCSGNAYTQRSKLEALLGPQLWDEISGKTVIDFGCGSGQEAIEMARCGAQKVIGIDNRTSVLERACAAAHEAGVADRCLFVNETRERADVIVSIDGFEHFEDPAGVLRAMRGLVNEKGLIRIAFGPTWLHPLGGHLFSVFPWAHLLFTENALIRWRADFKADGATRFCEVQGGLNQMTIGRFKKLLAASEFDIVTFEAVPIKRLRTLSNPLTREFFTACVRCTLTPKAS